MVPAREKPKRISMRPIAALAICIISIAVLIARGGPWRAAGYILALMTVLGTLAFRIFARRLAHAREPDPQSTLKL